MSERADRLGVSLFMFGLVNQPPREAMAATWPLLTVEQIALFRDLTEEDISLANACLEVEAERRSLQWTALELLSARNSPSITEPPRTATTGGAGDAPPMVVVPAAVLADACRTVLLWNRAAPQGD